MSGFDTRWLDLREPADHAARDAGLKTAFAEALSSAPHITDIGCGTGSTCRALGPSIPDARWRLVDHDAGLLAEAQRRVAGAETVQADLTGGLERLLAPADAVTASALIDLVSRDWLSRFSSAARGKVIYIALTYDGRDDWMPPHAADAAVSGAFQEHQRRDKGFGPALGSEAVAVLSDMLTDKGWHVRTAPSPWRLKRGTSGALMDELAKGIARAVVEAGVPAEAAQGWLSARMAGETATVGHTDLLAIPA